MHVLNDPQYWHMQAEEMARWPTDEGSRHPASHAQDRERLKRAEERLASVTHEHD
jgi:hypothetical protein